ncbi:MAG TPA: dienelactone hydrolase family protein [Caulobacteraceae bacterium]|jgi:dienelactone hydrolase
MDLVSHAARLDDHLTVLKPATPGPFAVILQLHDCGGVQPVQFRYAEAAVAAGVAAVVVDSYAPRGISRLEAQMTVCTGLRLRGYERAVDLLAMLTWLQSQPWADLDRVAVAGWSHGGWAAMDALTGTADGSEAVRDRLARLRAAILFYPYAGPLSRTHSQGWGANRPRVYACLAGRDSVVGKAAPLRAMRRLTDDGLDVQILNLPEATHCFDDERSNAPRARYSPDLAEQAMAFYVDALKEAVLEP